MKVHCGLAELYFMNPTRDSSSREILLMVCTCYQATCRGRLQNSWYWGILGAERVLQSAVGMTHSLRSDLWWVIPFRFYLVIFGIPFTMIKWNIFHDWWFFMIKSEELSWLIMIYHNKSLYNWKRYIVQYIWIYLHVVNYGIYTMKYFC